MAYIHYGSSHFDSKRFIPVHNEIHPWVKPMGGTGLWGTPENSEYGWKEWCEFENFNVEKLATHFRFDLKSDSKILYVRNDEELSNIIDFCISTSSILGIDFEKLMNIGYDAMEVHVTTNDIYMKLYGWDCDSIIVFNKDCIIELD